MKTWNVKLKPSILSLLSYPFSVLIKI